MEWEIVNYEEDRSEYLGQKKNSFPPLCSLHSGKQDIYRILDWWISGMWTPYSMLWPKEHAWFLSA